MSTSQAVFTQLPPFFESSPHSDLKDCLRQIENEFGLKINKYHHDQYSFGNDVLTVNNKYIFRFPKSKEAKQHLKHEIELLEFLHGKVKLDIPHYTFISKNKEFGGYELIPGKPLYVPLTKKVSKKNKMKMVGELMGFINVFHAIDLKQFVQFKPLVKKDFVKTEQEVEVALQEKLFPKLSLEDRGLIRDFYTEAKSIVGANTFECPIHGDLYEWNVLWDKKTEQCGLIDFSDYMISDPARDFEVFFDFGPDYPEMAYEKYTGHKDPDFLKRAKAYWQLHGIYTLMSSQLGANMSFDYAYKNYFKRKLGE